MKSPFPGMDPYIEACGLWEGFHNRLVHNIDEALSKVLPHGYSIDTAVRTYIAFVKEEGKDSRLAKPDVTITSPTSEKGKKKRGKGSVALAEADEETGSVPMQAYIAEEIKESFVEIYAEREERNLVTCIEVLSPANKRPGTDGWKLYEQTRHALLLGRANFIEIDLLRSGEKSPMLTPWPECAYRLLVSRAGHAPMCRVWPVQLQQRLPVIPVPLLPRDADLSLDLQPLIDHIYELGRYDERIDYGTPLIPPLSEKEAEWSRKLLKTKS